MCSGACHSKGWAWWPGTLLLFLTCGLKDKSTSPMPNINKSVPCRTYRSGTANPLPSQPQSYTVTAGHNLCTFPLCSPWAPQLPHAAAGWAVFSSRSTAMPLHCSVFISYAANAVALLVWGTFCGSTVQGEICARRWLKCCFCLVSVVRFSEELFSTSFFNF